MAKYKTQENAITSVTLIAENEDGYLEKASNSNLDSKTGNAGYNNYTKYWRDLNKLGLMKGYISDPNFAGGSLWYWCAAFITWCFVQAFGIDLAKSLLKHLPFISCQTLADKAGNQLYSSPKVGDIVLFYNGSRFSHTGFVYKVEGSYFYTIEGNTNSSNGVVANGGSVNRKQYSISTYQKKGTKFFRPDYSLVVDPSINSGSNTVTKPSTTKVKVVKIKTDDTLNCRNKADISGSILGEFKLNKILTLIEKTNKNWWKVKGKTIAGKTITGYCSTSYLSIVTYVTVITKSDPLNCRSKANGSATLKGKFAKGTQLELLEKTNSSWWKVKGKSTDGKTITGYCSTTYLKIV